MGLFDSAKTKEEKAKKAFESLLLPGEVIEDMKKGFSTFDSFVITNKRLILKDNEFDWGDSKAATFSVAPSKISSISITSDTGVLVKKHRVGIHVGDLTVKLTYYSKEEAEAAYILLSNLLYC